MNVPDVNNERTDVMKGNCIHKCLGRNHNGDMTKCCHICFQHRVHLASAKFNHCRDTVTNKHISVKLHLRLFGAVATLTILFGSVTMPLTAFDLYQLDATQRRMLLSFVSWVRVQDEPWRDTMIRMNERVRWAFHYQHFESWNHRFANIFFFCHTSGWNMWWAKTRSQVVPF